VSMYWMPCLNQQAMPDTLWSIVFVS
jgi:hypothetical protein